MTEAPPSRRTQYDYGREQYDYGRAEPDYGRAESDYTYGYGNGNGNGRAGRGTPPRRRRKWPLVLLALVVLLGGGAAAAVAVGGRSLLPASLFPSNSQKPVGLSDSTGQQAAAPAGGAAAAGNPDGRWAVQRGNATFVGYRVREKFATVPAPNDAVGRTPLVVGGMVIKNGQVTAAQVTGDLRRLASDKAKRDDVIRNRGLQTNAFPQASFQLKRPVNLVAARITYGKVANLNTIGALTLHGVTRQVQLVMQSRWDGNTMQVVGRLPINFADYQIQAPSVGGFVSVQPQGQVEFSLVLQRA